MSILELLSLLNLILCNKNFIPYYYDTLKPARKQKIKIKLVTKIVLKEWLEVVWENKTITGLNSLFMAYPNWWDRTAIIYTQLTTKTIYNFTIPVGVFGHFFS